MADAAKALDRIYQVAADQDGYFSTAQLRDTEVGEPELRRLTANRHIDRELRGVYRLARLPVTAHGYLWPAVLWPLAPAGTPAVISHETALDLWDVSDVNPAKVHITLPTGTRLRRRIPELYRVHFGDIPAGNLQRVEGLPVTSLYRTIVDLLLDRTGPADLKDVIARGRAQSLLTDDEAGELAALAQVKPALLAHVAGRRPRNASSTK